MSSNYGQVQVGDYAPPQYFRTKVMPSKLSSPSYDAPEGSYLRSRYPDRINGLFYSVHKQLKDHAAARNRMGPVVPSVIAATMSKERPREEVRMRQSTGKNEQTAMPQYLNVENLAQLKAHCLQKKQQGMRRRVGRPNEANNFTSQKRIKEIIRQKTILQDILVEHRKLQRDRRAIAGELQSMRHYLNDIKEKLDSSLKKLNTKTNVFDNYCKAPQVSQIMNKAVRGGVSKTQQKFNKIMMRTKK